MINSSGIVLYLFFLKYLIRYFFYNKIVLFMIIDYSFD
jgi:hypothetical protein